VWGRGVVSFTLGVNVEGEKGHIWGCACVQFIISKTTKPGPRAKAKRADDGTTANREERDRARRGETRGWRDKGRT
jgi:hypothetical protein